MDTPTIISAAIIVTVSYYSAYEYSKISKASNNYQITFFLGTFFLLMTALLNILLGLLSGIINYIILGTPNSSLIVSVIMLALSFIPVGLILYQSDRKSKIDKSDTLTKLAVSRYLKIKYVIFLIVLYLPFLFITDPRDIGTIQLYEPQQTNQGNQKLSPTRSESKIQTPTPVPKKLKDYSAYQGELLYYTIPSNWPTYDKRFGEHTYTFRYPYGAEIFDYDEYSGDIEIRIDEVGNKVSLSVAPYEYAQEKYTGGNLLEYFTKYWAYYPDEIPDYKKVKYLEINFDNGKGYYNILETAEGDEMKIVYFLGEINGIPVRVVDQSKLPQEDVLAIIQSLSVR